MLPQYDKNANLLSFSSKVYFAAKHSARPNYYLDLKEVNIFIKKEINPKYLTCRSHTL
jgi:hypothetical protein